MTLNLKENTVVLHPQQKLQLALANTKVKQDSNIQWLNEWYQHLQQKTTTSSQQFTFATTHTGYRTTIGTIQNTLPGVEKHAHYYDEILGVSLVCLERLQTFGENWQPTQIGTWLEMNQLGVNAGWCFPVNLPQEQFTQLIDQNNTHKKILNRWANLCQGFTCISYGESFASPSIYQMELTAGTSLDIASQFYKALTLADFLQVPTFPAPLLDILQRYDAQQLVISLWLTRQSVVKFGLRILKPTSQLFIALCMLAGLSKENQDKLTMIDAFMTKIDWVEIQQTADGLLAEVSFQL